LLAPRPKYATAAKAGFLLPFAADPSDFQIPSVTNEFFIATTPTPKKIYSRRPLRLVYPGLLFLRAPGNQFAILFDGGGVTPESFEETIADGYVGNCH